MRFFQSCLLYAQIMIEIRVIFFTLNRALKGNCNFRQGIFSHCPGKSTTIKIRVQAYARDAYVNLVRIFMPATNKAGRMFVVRRMETTEEFAIVF